MVQPFLDQAGEALDGDDGRGSQEQESTHVDDLVRDALDDHHAPGGETGDRRAGDDQPHRHVMGPPPQPEGAGDDEQQRHVNQREHDVQVGDDGSLAQVVLQADDVLGQKGGEAVAEVGARRPADGRRDQRAEGHQPEGHSLQREALISQAAPPGEETYAQHHTGVEDQAQPHQEQAVRDPAPAQVGETDAARAGEHVPDRDRGPDDTVESPLVSKGEQVQDEVDQRGDEGDRQGMVEHNDAPHPPGLVQHQPQSGR